MMPASLLHEPRLLKTRCNGSSTFYFTGNGFRCLNNHSLRLGMRTHLELARPESIQAVSSQGQSPLLMVFIFTSQSTSSIGSNQTKNVLVFCILRLSFTVAGIRKGCQYPKANPTVFKIRFCNICEKVTKLHKQTAFKWAKHYVI